MGQRGGGALGAHERRRAGRVGSATTRRARRAQLVLDGGVERLERPDRRGPGAAMLIGPWRYSKSGYASVHACALSRIFSAASLGQADGPAAAEERPLLDRRRVGDGQRRLERARRVGGGGGRGAGLRRDSRSSVSAPVAKRVCTTDCSSANGSAIAASARSADRGAGAVGDRRRACARRGRAPSACTHLARGAGARDRDEHVVAAPGRQLGGRERVRPAVAGALAQRRVGLGHEQRRPAADRRRRARPAPAAARPAARERRRRGPDLGLRRELLAPSSCAYCDSYRANRSKASTAAGRSRSARP